MSQPNPGQVYLHPDGRPMLYVRTEQQHGKTEHLFICARERVVFQLWVKDVPPEFQLVVDTDGRKQAAEQQWLTLVAEHERDLALGLLKQAVAWLPSERANELRERWRDAQPPEEEG